MKIVSLLCFYILSVSCQGVKSHESDPLDEIKAKFHVAVKSLPEESVNGNYVIQVDNLNTETRKGYSPVLLSSQSALIIFERLSEEQKNSTQMIQVYVNSIFKMDLYKFKLTDLQRITPFLKVAKAGAEDIASGDYEGFFKMADSSYLKKADYDNYIKTKIKPFPEYFEGIDEIKDGGFEFEESDGINVIRVYYNSISSTNVSLSYEIAFVDNGNCKIGGLYVQQKAF